MGDGRADDFRVASDIFRTGKMMSLIREGGAEAVLALLRLWAWAAEQSPTEGKIGSEANLLDICGQGPEILPHLAPWLDESEAGEIYIHDWADHQPWCIRAKERKEQARKAGLASAKKRAEQQAFQQTVNSQLSGSSTDSSRTPRTPLPLPSPKSKISRVGRPTLSPPSAAKGGASAKPPPGFLKFWEAYPHRNGVKRGRKAALTLWRKAKLEQFTDGILSALDQQIKHAHRCRQERVFVAEFPDPERWIKNSRWHDEVKS